MSLFGLWSRLRPSQESRPRSQVVLAVIVVVHVIAALLLILFILLHAGRGGGLSEMFGGGMGGGLSGSSAVERNLDRITVMTALIFALTSVALVLMLD